MNVEKKALTAWASSERARFEDTLKQFVEIPSVSADPAHQKDIRVCADAAAQLIRDFGGDAKILKTDGNPIVHGRFKAGTGAAHAHHLQPHGRAARLQRDRALAPSRSSSPRRATATWAAVRPTTKDPRSPRCGASAQRARPASP